MYCINEVRLAHMGLPPRPLPKVISSSVPCMGRCRRRTEFGPAPRAGLSGDITCTAPARGRGRSAGGAGGVRREENSIRVRLPRLAPLQGFRRYCLRSGAEDPWRASMVLFDGGGAPTPAPPRGGRIGGGGGARSAGGVGREESGVWGFLPDYALPGPSPR